jgi:hypothetical protein
MSAKIIESQASSEELDKPNDIFQRLARGEKRHGENME